MNPVLKTAPGAKPSVFAWQGVGFSVGEKSILQNQSGEVRAGEVVAIMGGSGAGKTSLLNTLAGRLGPGSEIITQERSLETSLLMASTGTKVFAI